VFADIDPRTWLADFSTLSGPVDALLPVDTFGNQWSASAHCQKPGVVDAAHGFGLPEAGKRGILEVNSLSHTKIPTAGEGGLILTDDDVLCGRVRDLRHFAARMPEFSAILAIESARQYVGAAGQRREIVRQYQQELRIEFATQEVPRATTDGVFAVRVSDLALKKRICESLCKDGIELRIYYEPLERGLPETEQLFSEILCLPAYPGVKRHMERIIDLVNGCI